MRVLLPATLLLVVGCSAQRPLPPSAIHVAGHHAREVRVSPEDAPRVHAGRSTRFGFELRAYPAGLIPALYGEAPLSADSALVFDLGANLTDRSDFGEHEDEEGSGFGGGIGYRHFLGEGPDRWFVGGRVDLWSLSIDWEDPPSRTGSSDVIVVQPTVEGGYSFTMGEAWRWNVFAAFGAEINVDTDGEDVGEGAIGILGVSWVYQP